MIISRIEDVGQYAKLVPGLSEAIERPSVYYYLTLTLITVIFAISLSKNIRQNTNKLPSVF
jgi:hypothetical protein